MIKDSMYSYNPLPSTFQIIEYPIRCISDDANNPSGFGASNHKMWQTYDSLINGENFLRDEALKNKNILKNFYHSFNSCYYQTKRFVLSTPMILATGSALAVSVILAPLTTVIDMIIGVAEIAFASYKGYNKSELLNIAQKKFVASPAQHLTYVISFTIPSLIFTIVGMRSLRSLNQCIIPFLLIGGALGPIIYRENQKIIGALPQFLRPDGFNIFIEGGARDREGRKFTEWEKSYNDYKTKREKEEPRFQNPIQNTDLWKEFISKEKHSLTKVENATSAYDSFKNGIIEDKTPQQLLGLNDSFSKDALNKTFRTLATKIHPDRNLDRKDEATILMKYLNEARLHLEKTFEANS